MVISKLPERARRGDPDGHMTVQRSLEAFMSSIPIATPITGSKGGNAALASLLSALEAAGLIIDHTS